MNYTNPVIPGFHPDPSVCRVGDDYFAAVSSFAYFPGVPILHSRNLVDWTHVGNALTRTSQLDLGGTTFGMFLGIFAPTLRFHDGRFWLATTRYSDDGPWNFVVTATDPSGPWSDPTPIPLPAIDPDLAWDDTGHCWVHSSDGTQILRAKVDLDSGTVLAGPEPTWSGTGLQFPEAPHLFRRADTWYLLIAEGGTERGHAVSIARGPSPTGPWESCPHNPILSHRSTDRPIQNTGHADLVEAPDGTWWMLLLGTRPRGRSPGYHVLGRETFLAPVEWVDGWPRVEPVQLTSDRRPPGPREPIAPEHRDDFDRPELDPRWISVRRPPSAISSTATRDGWLELKGDGNTLDSPFPTMVARRQQHRTCCARALVDRRDAAEAGLTLYMDERHHFEVAVAGDETVVRIRIGPASTVIARRAMPAGPTVLTVTTRRAHRGPDDVVLGVEHPDGEHEELATLDGRYLSTEVAGGMTGRVVGVYAIGGSAFVDWFDYRPTTETDQPLED